MEGIHVYRLLSRLVRPFPCINKTCEIYGNPSMATCITSHITHLPVDGLIVCKSCKIWSYIIGGMWYGWRASTCMCYIPGLWDLFRASTRYVEQMATHLWPLVPHIISHTSLGMAGWYVNTENFGPISLVVCGLDGGHPCVWIDFQTCPTFPIHQQDM